MMDARTLLAIARRDFPTFARKGFQVLNPGVPLEDSWVLDAVAHTLGQMADGQVRRQIINMPPRMLKSQICSVMWPAFSLGQNPALKVVVVSYAEPLAVQLSNDTRRLMQSDFYRSAFPDTRLERQTNSHLTTTEGGSRFATTIGGSVTGFGGDLIILDDPMNASDAQSEPARDRVQSFFQGTLSSRLNNLRTGKILIVMQRLHEHDLSGHVIEQGGWSQLKLPARASEDVEVSIGPGLTHKMRAGDYLSPARLPQVVLDEQRRAMGSMVYEAQYQQEPAPADGLLLRRDWLHYRAAPPPDPKGRLVLSIDTAVKDQPSNDYSVCTTWREVDGRHYLLDVWRDRVQFPDLVSKVQRIWIERQPDALLIEDAGSGAQLMSELRVRRINATACKPDRSKPVRFMAALTAFEAGNVYLPKHAPWLSAFEAELLAFPAGRFDDQVDAVSQYFGWVQEHAGDRFEVFWT